MSTDSNQVPSTWTQRAKLAFGAFALIGAFFLIVEHGAHLFPYLPWLLLAACPLMHLFMHGGHGHHADHTGHNGHGRPGTDSSLTSTAQSGPTNDRAAARSAGDQCVRGGGQP